MNIFSQTVVQLRLASNNRLMSFGFQYGKSKAYQHSITTPLIKFNGDLI